MKSLFIFTCLTCAVVINARPANYNQGASSVSQPKPGAAIDEVIVESSLYIKNKKNQGRRTRDTEDVAVNNPSSSGLRVKREPKRRPHDQSTANAAANSQYFGSEGFGAGAANAQAQGFNNEDFGANSANTQTQSFHVGPNGLQGTAGASLSQVYRLPNGKTINVAFSNTLSSGADGAAQSNANGITYS